MTGKTLAHYHVLEAEGPPPLTVVMNWAPAARER